jgi:hypothetical protein
VFNLWFIVFLEHLLEEKGAGRMVQVVECLASKREALSSNNSTTKKLARFRRPKAACFLLYMDYRPNINIAIL